MKTSLLNAFTLLFLMEIIASLSGGKTFTEESPKNLMPIKVLLVGNSQCPTIISNQMLEKLAVSDKGGIPIKVGGCIKGGASLKTHWEAGLNKGSAREMIASGNWDFVVLQDIYNTQEPAFQPYARLFHELIKKTGKQTVLFGTASILSDFPKGFERQHRLHLAMGRELGVLIVDSSEAYKKYFGSSPTPEKMESLFAKDKAHPGLLGSYLYSCGIYSAITGRTTVGLAFPESISADVAKNIQDIAWEQYKETTEQIKK